MESSISCFICHNSNSTYCLDCQTYLCSKCMQNHKIGKCYICEDITCSFTLCFHNKSICTLCWNNYELMPHLLVSCNSCSEYCPCCIPSLDSEKCSVCNNYPFMCPNCNDTPRNKVKNKNWEHCVHCNQICCPCCFFFCTSCTNPNNPHEKSPICSNCADLHRSNHHSNNILSSLSSNLEQPQECLVCYNDSKSLVNFPGCKHPPKLCTDCAKQMENLKCIVNCSNSKSFILDLWDKYFKPINNIKKIELNNFHPHTLFWQDNVRFICDNCSIKGNNCYVCNLCNVTLCSDCLGNLFSLDKPGPTVI